MKPSLLRIEPTSRAGTIQSGTARSNYNFNLDFTLRNTVLAFVHLADPLGAPQVTLPDRRETRLELIGLQLRLAFLLLVLELGLQVVGLDELASPPRMNVLRWLRLTAAMIVARVQALDEVGRVVRFRVH